VYRFHFPSPPKELVLVFDPERLIKSNGQIDFPRQPVKRFRAEDEEKIKKLGIRIKDLEATAKHNVEVDAPIDAEIKDSVMIRDTVPVFLKAVKMDTPS